MHIVYLATEAHGGRGGIAQYNKDMLEALAAYSEDTHVTVIPRLTRESLGELPPNLDYITQASLGKLSFLAKTLGQIPKKMDVVVCAHINLLPLAYLLAGLKKVPLVLMVYGIDVWTRPPVSGVDYLLKRVDVCISISQHTAQKFVQWSRVKEASIQILHNAIHMDHYEISRKSPELLSRYKLAGRKVLMTMGRMSATESYKGFDEVIDVLPELKQRIPEIMYLACGDGDDKIRLEEKAKKLGVNDNIVFPGYIHEAEKVDHYNLADVYVMPSHGEGFGFVVLEALACGVPVIASNADGTREAVLNGRMGLLVDPGNTSQLIDAILDRLTIPKQISPLLNEFSFDSFKNKVHRILSTLS